VCLTAFCALKAMLGLCNGAGGRTAVRLTALGTRCMSAARVSGSIRARLFDEVELIDVGEMLLCFCCCCWDIGELKLVFKIGVDG